MPRGSRESIFAVSDKVGIGSTAPLAKLDVKGNINATDVFSSGVTTVATAFNVGTGGTIIAGTTNGLVGFGTAVPEFIVDIKSPVSTGQTTLNVFGDTVISGDIKIDNNINLSGVSTFGALLPLLVMILLYQVALLLQVLLLLKHLVDLK